MKVLILSIGDKVFEEGSSTRSRLVRYGSLVDELHVVVYTKPGFRMEKISQNTYLYPTNSKLKFLYFFSAYNLSKKIIKERGISVVTSQESFTSMPAFLLMAKFQFVFQAQVHTDFVSPYFKRESLKNFLRYLVYLFAVKKADCVRVVSERIKNSLSVDSEVLPIFVDIEKIANVTPSFDLHKKYPQFDFIFLVVSRLTKEKNVSLALSAFKKVLEKHSKAGLVVVGDGEEREKLQKESKDLGITENIVFEGWQKDTISYYKTADAYLLTSNYEGFGMSLVEAAASMCPIVSTNVGISGALLSDKISALVCPPGSEECISKRMLELIESDTLGRELSEKAKEVIGENLEVDEEKYLKKHVGLWSTCLKRQG